MLDSFFEHKIVISDNVVEHHHVRIECIYCKNITTLSLTRKTYDSFKQKQNVQCRGCNRKMKAEYKGNLEWMIYGK